MKKIFSILLVLMMVLSLTGTAFAQALEFFEVPGSKQSLVALGDSITAGYGLEQNPNIVSRKAYPQLLGDEIGYRVTNLAKVGMTSNEVLDAVKYNNRYRSALSQGDMIIINVGGADMLRFILAVSEGELELNDVTINIFISNLFSNITSIIGEVKSLNPDASILLFNVYQPYPVAFIIGEPQYSSLLPLLYEVNTFIEVTATLNNLYFLDAYGVFEAYPGNTAEKAVLLFLDEVHPSALGQEILFKAAYEVIGEIYHRPMPPGLRRKVMTGH